MGPWGLVVFLKRLVGKAGELQDGERFDVGVNGLLRWLAKQQSNVLEASIEHYSPQEAARVALCTTWSRNFTTIALSAWTDSSQTLVV